MGTLRIVGLLAGLLAVAAVIATLAGGALAQGPSYMAAPDGPGSVWRLNVQTGELEHCSLVKSGCDVIDRND